MTDTSTTPPIKSKRTSPWVWLTMLIGLIALGLSLGVALYFYYHASAWQASFSASAQELSDMQHTLKQNKRAIATLNESMQNLTADDKASHQTLIQLQTQVNTLHTQLSTLPLAHVLYLAQLAQDALLYQFDANKAATYLQAAHNELTQSTDAELQALAGSLQQTLTTLNTMPLLNIAKIVSQLSAVQDSINALPLTQTEPENTVKTENAQRSFWNKLWNNAWQGLQKVITVKHYGAEAPHFITPDERAYLNARLCLYLAQAQWAAIAHNTVLFQSSIQDAERWLRSHYDINNATAQSILQQLKPLENTNLQPNFPELSPLINRIQQALISNGK
jgi:uroporphyrin-III C-methyltransferase